jgi:hypothetical protein
LDVCALTVAKVQDLGAVGRFDSLFEHEQKLQDAALARAICAEEAGYRSKTHFAGIAPAFEVLNTQGSKQGRLRS